MSIQRFGVYKNEKDILNGILDMIFEGENYRGINQFEDNSEREKEVKENSSRLVQIIEKLQEQNDIFVYFTGYAGYANVKAMAVLSKESVEQPTLKFYVLAKVKQYDFPKQFERKLLRCMLKEERVLEIYGSRYDSVPKDQLKEHIMDLYEKDEFVPDSLIIE